MKRLIGILILAIFAPSGRGVVSVTTTRESETNEQREFGIERLEASLARGEWDNDHIEFKISPDLAKKMGRSKYLVARESYHSLSQPLRRKIATELYALGSTNELATYRVTVDISKNPMRDEPALDRLGIDPDAFSGMVPAEKLLSPYAQTWAYKLSPRDGQNCWHTSIASIFPGWTIARRMPAEEFSCHLQQSFTRISSPTQWGDLIRLFDHGEEVHGFTFLGVDSEDASRQIVFTKNGRMQSRFLYMDLATVSSYVYPGNDIEFYRPIKNAIDPAADSTAPCFGKTEGWTHEDPRDVLVRAGLQLKGTKALSPL